MPPRQDYNRYNQQQQGYPPPNYPQQQQHYHPQQHSPGYHDQADHQGDFPRDQNRPRGPHHSQFNQHPQQEQVDPRGPRGNNGYYGEGYDNGDPRGRDYNQGTLERRPPHPDFDRRANNSYEGGGYPPSDSSFERGSQGQPLRHSHYDDRSLPRQNSDPRYRQAVPNGAHPSASPRHQSIPPAHQEHPNYASISRSPAALQYERVSFHTLLESLLCCDNIYRNT